MEPMLQTWMISYRPLACFVVQSERRFTTYWKPASNAKESALLQIQLHPSTAFDNWKHFLNDQPVSQASLTVYCTRYRDAKPCETHRPEHLGESPATRNLSWSLHWQTWARHESNSCHPIHIQCSKGNQREQNAHTAPGLLLSLYQAYLQVHKIVFLGPEQRIHCVFHCGQCWPKLFQKMNEIAFHRCESITSYSLSISGWSNSPESLRDATPRQIVALSSSHTVV